MLVGHWGPRRWAWTTAQPGALIFRLMCRPDRLTVAGLIRAGVDVYDVPPAEQLTIL